MQQQQQQILRQQHGPQHQPGRPLRAAALQQQLQRPRRPSLDDEQQQRVPLLILPALPVELQQLVVQRQRQEEELLQLRKRGASPVGHAHRSPLLVHPFCSLAPALLTEQIKRCDSWHAAAVVFAQQAPCLNHISAAALLVRLAQLSSSSTHQPHSAEQPQQQRPANWRALVRQVLVVSEPLLARASTRQLATMAWALAKLGYHEWLPRQTSSATSSHDSSSSSSCEETGCWSQTWQQRVLHSLPQASCRDVANILWALATSASSGGGGGEGAEAAGAAPAARGASPPPSSYETDSSWWSPALLPSGQPHQHHHHKPQQQQFNTSSRLAQELLSALHRTLPTSSSQDVANACWALARLRLAPSAELAHFLLVRGQMHFAGLRPREVAMLLWSLAQLGVAPPPAWLAECLQRQVGRPAWRGMQPRHYVMVLVTCAHLQLAPPTPWLVEALQQLRELLLLPLPPSPQQQQRRAQDLSNTLWALARLRVLPNAAWMDAALAASAASLAAANPQELTNSIWALARLHVAPNAAWLAAFDAASLACMHQFAPHSLADLLAAQVHLKQQPSPAWCEAWAGAVKAAWPAADASAVVKLLWAAAKFQLPLGRAWLTRALAVSHGAVLAPALAAGRLSCEELLRLVWAVGRLCRGLLSQPLADLLGLYCCRAAGRMSGQQLVRGAWGLARLVPLPRDDLVAYFWELAASRAPHLPADQAAELQARLAQLRDAAVRGQWLGRPLGSEAGGDAADGSSSSVEGGLGAVALGQCSSDADAGWQLGGAQSRAAADGVLCRN